MIRNLFRVIFMIMVFFTTSCIKDTYDMNMLSEKVHLSPTLAISAIKGDISFSDMVKSNDTIVFDQDNFVRIIIKRDSIIDLIMSDFVPVKNLMESYERDMILPDLQLFKPGYSNSKGLLAQLEATIEPDTLDLEIDDILKKLTGDIHLFDPIIRLIYVNSFLNPIQIVFNATGIRDGETVDLDLAPFTLSYPADEFEHQVSDTYVIDKDNSSLPELISMPPEKIYFSGSAIMDVPVVKSLNIAPVIESNRLIGSLEIEVPLDFSLNNIQFTDTVDNFLANAFDEDSDLSWDDFELFKIDIDVLNGFPMGASLNMALYDSLNQEDLVSIDATDFLEPAPVDINGRATGVKESSTSIEFTQEFFSSINLAENIILRFTLNTTENGLNGVKIYSDYRIDFKASLVMKADINLK